MPNHSVKTRAYQRATSQVLPSQRPVPPVQRKADLSNPKEMARYVLFLKDQLRRPIGQAEAKCIAEAMTATSFPEVPFLLWSLVNQNPQNVFVVHPFVSAFLVALSDRPTKEVETYMATHRNTVDAKRFPVYAHLMELGAFRFNVATNRFVWA